MKAAPVLAGIVVLASLGALALPVQQADRSVSAAPATLSAPDSRVAAAVSATPSVPATTAAPAEPATPAKASAPPAPAAKAAPSTPPAPAAPAAKSPASFEQMKGLLGEWEGKYEGKVGHVSFKLVSGGTAIMETMDPSEGEDMVTLYYPDGDRLMLTHYCASNNQPRMRTDAASSDPTKLVFNYVDATNLAASKSGVMTALTVNFVDADHFTQTWTWVDKVGGTPTMATFEYARKK